MKQYIGRFLLVVLAVVVVSCAAVPPDVVPAYAKSAEEIDGESSGTYPWESGLEAIRTSLTGPVAGTVAVAAFALCTWQIIRGAELSAWVAPMIVAALAVATMINAESLITTLSGTTINGGM